MTQQWIYWVFLLSHLFSTGCWRSFYLINTNGYRFKKPKKKLFLLARVTGEGQPSQMENFQTVTILLWPNTTEKLQLHSQSYKQKLSGDLRLLPSHSCEEAPFFFLRGSVWEAPVGSLDFCPCPEIKELPSIPTSSNKAVLPSLPHCIRRGLLNQKIQ